ncbi:MAG: SpoIIE family protein phosphatase [Oscillospiraceae bacterium]|nr:SpoIIE family protein phosphatase [Oscillospiraceae bacterium]
MKPSKQKKTKVKKRKRRSNPIPRVQLIVVVTIMLSVSAVFFTIYSMLTNSFLEDIKERASNVKGYVEQVINNSSFDFTSEETPASAEAKASLKQLQDVAGLSHLYTVSLDDNGNPLLALKSLYDDQQGKPHDLSEELSRDLLLCFEKGEIIEGNGIYKVDWGSVYSMFWPVFDNSKKVIGVVGMEFDMTSSDESNQQAIFFSLIVSGALIVIFCLVSSMALQGYLKENRRVEHSAHRSELARGRAEAANEAVMSSITYASKIQRNILPLKDTLESAFTDYSVLWAPRDIVGGDVYWMKQFQDGVVLCVADCTGHGTPGAFLTMLVVSSLENAVDDRVYKDPAEIIWRLEQRIVSVFNVHAENRVDDSGDINDGCDLAVLFISNDGHISISAGNTSVFVCDGEKTNRIRGQKIYVGEGKIDKKDDIKTVHVPYNPANKFYIASDGIFDQKGSENGKSFGYKRFEKLLLENHQYSQAYISDIVWQEFERFRGTERRRDDVELISFIP